MQNKKHFIYINKEQNINILSFYLNMLLNKTPHRIVATADCRP